jgi:hypothetical protein
LACDHLESLPLNPTDSGRVAAKLASMVLAVPTTTMLATTTPMTLTTTGTRPRFRIVGKSLKNPK